MRLATVRRSSRSQKYLGLPLERRAPGHRRLEISGAAAGRSERSWRDPPAGYKAACHACHGDDLVEMQKLTPAQWDREVKKMEGWGAQVKPEERDAILKYLSDRYRP